MPSEIYNYEASLQRYVKNMKALRNGYLALRFLDHLASLGLSVARISKYAGHLLVLLRVMDFDLRAATREDVRKVVAWINSQRYTELTKRAKKLLTVTLLHNLTQKAHLSMFFSPVFFAYSRASLIALNGPHSILLQYPLNVLQHASDKPFINALPVHR